MLLALGKINNNRQLGNQTLMAIECPLRHDQPASTFHDDRHEISLLQSYRVYGEELLKHSFGGPDSIISCDGCKKSIGIFTIVSESAYIDFGTMSLPFGSTLDKCTTGGGAGMFLSAGQMRSVCNQQEKSTKNGPRRGYLPTNRPSLLYILSIGTENGSK